MISMNDIQVIAFILLASGYNAPLTVRLSRSILAVNSGSVRLIG